MEITLLSLILCVSVSSAKDGSLPPGFTEVAGNEGQFKKVLTPYTTYPVTLEEYSPKVIIKGSWGAGQGEFGFYQVSTGGEIVDYAPSHFVVDSKGFVYILDIVNNRIQKYDKEGQYLKSISVLSFAYMNGKSVNTKEIASPPPFYVGLDLMIDSLDNVYYHYKKGNDEELTKFTKDKPGKQYQVPKHMNVQYKENGTIYFYDEQNKKWFDLDTRKEYMERNSTACTKKNYSITATSNDKMYIQVISDKINATIDLPLVSSVKQLKSNNCFLLNGDTVRLYTTPWVPLNTGVIECDLNGRVSGVVVNPTEIDSNFYHLYDKYGAITGGTLGNDGYGYVLTGNGDMKILRNEISHR